VRWFGRRSGRAEADRPGYYKGRHFTTYVEEVKALKRKEQLEEAERLLLELVKASEAEDKVDKLGVAPWYYEQLAMLHRKRKDYAAEVEVLERFARQRHAPGVTPSRLLARLEKARALLESSERAG